MDEQEKLSSKMWPWVTCTCSNFTTWLKTRFICVRLVPTHSSHNSLWVVKLKAEGRDSEKWKCGRSKDMAQLIHSVKCSPSNPMTYKEDPRRSTLLLKMRRLDRQILRPHSMCS